MDTLKVFQRRNEAMEKDGDIKYYDYDKALKVAKEKGVEEVDFFMADDRGSTEGTLSLEEIKEKKAVVGIKGSIWATPMIEINGETQECWTKEEQ